MKRRIIKVKNKVTSIFFQLKNSRMNPTDNLCWFPYKFQISQKIDNILYVIESMENFATSFFLNDT